MAGKQPEASPIVPCSVPCLFSCPLLTSLFSMPRCAASLRRTIGRLRYAGGDHTDSSDPSEQQLSLGAHRAPDGLQYETTKRSAVTSPSVSS